MLIKTMHTKTLTWLFFFIFIFFFSLFDVSLCDPRTSEAALHCGALKPPPNASFIPTFVAEMESLSELITKHHWGTHFVNSTPPMYGLAQCFNDLSHTDCLLCYAASRTKIPRCLPSLSATIYLDGCFLRYDSYIFYNEASVPGVDSVVCGGEEAADEAVFEGNVKEVVERVKRSAAENGGFGVAEVGGEVYGLGQCWETVGGEGCRECLEKGGAVVRGCGVKTEGRALNAGCYLRYSTRKFYNDQGETEHHEHGWFTERRGIIIAIVLAVVAFTMLSLFAAYAGYTKLVQVRKEGSNLGLVSISISKYSSLSFKYETLEKATDYFNSSRKIGEGGGGTVFKGTLPSGKTVAVKRLFYNTKQWVDEFFNEVNLISGIQHKHLVKLLGCSIEGPESLLVYEYVPNRSLDQFLFDKNSDQFLNWKQRFDIIVGTAEGIAYLHEGSEVRIIHRDIKSSNVLLDENLSPKIADFGLARCFALDKSHLSTGIAGTLGYMAPEYLVQGQLTEKADVYSFGVLVLEIVSGMRNSTFKQENSNTDSLLHKVWKHYRSNELAEVVDPRLKNHELPAKEVSNVLQIGLLCTQASVALRPSMAEVVLMLTANKETHIPVPNQPPFLSASTLEQASSINTANSSVSNTLTKAETFYTSSESSSMPSVDHMGNI
uniref:cysteine-rich receptor-like protein kinase 42 n=1 Tax=Fragaria vesca subsp. vesca TaxID=101020 RepID=UPI0005C8892C|nr:PREDICTED: cysteine-rich receptor-like protein kinase 42 [Fragaria vesca subsp. vesca]